MTKDEPKTVYVEPRPVYVSTNDGCSKGCLTAFGAALLLMFIGPVACVMAIDRMDAYVEEHPERFPEMQEDAR